MTFARPFFVSPQLGIFPHVPQLGQMGTNRDDRHSVERARVKEYTFRFLLEPTQSAMGDQHESDTMPRGHVGLLTVVVRR